MKLHPIPPGLYCVPSAIAAITGAPVEAVIFPALNRAMARRDTLVGTVAGVPARAIEDALAELGYRVRQYRGDRLRAHVATWAERSADRYPGRVLLLCTRTHCLVVMDGKVYDNHLPHGPLGHLHPYAKTTVVYAALVELAR